MLSAKNSQTNTHLLGIHGCCHASIRKEDCRGVSRTGDDPKLFGGGFGAVGGAESIAKNRGFLFLARSDSRENGRQTLGGDDVGAREKHDCGGNDGDDRGGGPLEHADVWFELVGVSERGRVHRRGDLRKRLPRSSYPAAPRPARRAPYRRNRRRHHRREHRERPCDGDQRETETPR